MFNIAVFEQMGDMKLFGEHPPRDRRLEILQLSMILNLCQVCRDVIKQYTASELLGSLYLNDTHKIWPLGPPYIAQRHAYKYVVYTAKHMAMYGIT